MPKVTKIVAALQRWMDSKSGQTFLNYAYSWGASVVILGTLFKLTHIPGANLMLFIGMGTEVVVFFLSAFDRPFEKSGNVELIDDSLPQNNTTEGTVIGGSTIIAGGSADTIEGENLGGATSGGVVGGGTIVIGGGVVGGTAGTTAAASDETETSGAETESSPFTPSPALQNAAAQQGIGGGSLLDIIRLANEELLQRAQASLTPEMEEASKQYVEKLQLLTETLDRVEKQSARLTTDSEEMTNLNRTLTGINTVYELQLKSVSQQIGTIDSINEQTRRMAAQIEELNGVYSRMIKALTVNMKNAATIVD